VLELTNDFISIVISGAIIVVLIFSYILIALSFFSNLLSSGPLATFFEFADIEENMENHYIIILPVLIIYTWEEDTWPIVVFFSLGFLFALSFVIRKILNSSFSIRSFLLLNLSWILILGLTGITLNYFGSFVHFNRQEIPIVWFILASFGILFLGHLLLEISFAILLSAMKKLTPDK
jgi:hypothetical protein